MATDGLRIFGQINNPLEPTSQPEVAPTDVGMPDEDMPLDEEERMIDEGGKVSPEVARYLGPESRCSGCIHFMEPGSCEIVAGEIAPDGVCSLWEGDVEGMPLEEPMIPEM